MLFRELKSSEKTLKVLYNLGVLPGESWPEVGAICWQIEILEINQRNRRRRLLTRL